MKNLFKKTNYVDAAILLNEKWEPLIIEEIKTQKIKQISYKMQVVFGAVLTIFVIYYLIKRAK